MAEAVYLLCGAAALVCALLLFRGYQRSRTSLLLWSSLCFAGLAASNALLCLDLMLLTDVDLSILRAEIGLASMVALICGLIWGMK
jgi:hypothetical protein